MAFGSFSRATSTSSPLNPMTRSIVIVIYAIVYPPLDALPSLSVLNRASRYETPLPVSPWMN